MPNTNPQAVKLANERFRPLADRLTQSYHFCKALRDQIAAEGIESLFTKDDDVVEDGSDIDGRSRLTNADIKGMIASVDEFLAFMDANPSMRDLLLRVSVNPFRL